MGIAKGSVQQLEPLPSVGMGQPRTEKVAVSERVLLVVDMVVLCYGLGCAVLFS